MTNDSPLSALASRIAESTTLAIAGRARRMQSEGCDVVSLGMGEPDFPTPDVVKRAAIRAIEENHTHYTQPNGIPELRAAVARKFERDNGVAATAESVLVSVGGKHSIANAMLALIDMGDEVLIPAPYWTSYPELVLLADGKPIIVDTRQSGYDLPVELLRAAVTQRTRALMLNSPSNPSGVMLGRERLEEIAAFAVEHNLVVISDELYEKIVYDNNEHVSIASLPGMAERTVTVNGVSKAFSMTGWRIGFATGPRPIIDAMARIQSQITSNPTSISQYAALAALTEITTEVDEMVAAFGRRRTLISELVGAIPDTSFPTPQGAFYLLVDVSSYLGGRVADDVALANHLLEHHFVSTVPGSAFGAPGTLRLSYASSESDLRKAAGRIAEGLREIRAQG